MPEPACYCSFFAGQPENWKPCSKEHYDMIRASPHEWPGYEVRELTVIPADHVLVPRELLERIEESLRSEIEERYAATKDHPYIRPKYLRDIAEVDELRAILRPDQAGS